MKKILFISCITVIILFFVWILLLLWDWLINDKIPNTTPIIVAVYGNTVHEDGTLSYRLKARLDAAHFLYLNYQVEKIIVSGGIWKEGQNEAEKMYEYLVKNHIPAENIFIDSSGYTTQDTSKNAFIFSKEENIILLPIVGVSQYFHIPRVKLSLKKEGFSEVYGFAPRYFELRDIYSTFREIFAYIKYSI